MFNRKNTINKIVESLIYAVERHLDDNSYISIYYDTQWRDNVDSHQTFEAHDERLDTYLSYRAVFTAYGNSADLVAFDLQLPYGFYNNNGQRLANIEEELKQILALKDITQKFESVLCSTV